MDILVSTTRQWNPGDEFIDRGCRYLLSYYLPAEANWHLWNRNPDLSKHPELDWHYRDGIISNCVRRLHSRLINAIVFSGSPEWLGPRCEPIFQFLSRNETVPLLLVGIGSAGPLNHLTDLERAILSRENTLIITRSPILAQEINHLLGLEKATYLPCPAIFSADSFSQYPGERKIGVVVQTDNSAQPIKPAHFVEICRAIKSSADDIEIIAFHESEYCRLKSLLPERKIRYNENSNAYFAMFSSFSAIVSTRLHGALAALSSGVPVALFSRDDYRVNSTVELVSSLTPSIKVSEAFQWASQIGPAHFERYQSEVFEFKREVSAKYHQVLSTFMKRFLPTTP